jgi:gamma-glutamyltranspeptidase
MFLRITLWFTDIRCSSSDAFGYLPLPENNIHPGKRPLSSISPTVIETADGVLYFVIGSAGGSRIITASIQNILAHARSRDERGASSRTAQAP